MARLRAAVSTVRDLSRTSEWICSRTTHPRDRTQPWSFKDHEMQIEIANCDAPKACTRKCSQVGLSELSVRIVLALLDIYPNSTAIYTLPTTGFARKFTKARIDTVIDGSDHLSSMLDPDNDSSELKQLGGSFLYISGSFGQGSAISVPADFLVRDEVDFSNQVALSTYASRLGHAENGGITRDFSTPTVEGYGISEKFAKSTQARYAVRCDHCSTWVAPGFLDDVVIPGYQDSILELDKSDLENPKYRIGEAFLKCPSCHSPLTQANLCDPDKRQWVHAHEIGTKEYVGFQVEPFDVAAVNPVSKTLMSLSEYKKKADWVNFKVGLPYEDAESSFLKEVITRNTTLSWLQPRELAGSGFILGMDVGKVCHLVIGRRDKHYLDVVHAERIKQDDDDAIFKRVVELLRMYGVSKAVVDAGPDFTTALKLIGHGYLNQVFACYYVRSTRASLANVDVKEVEQVINANRTGTIDELAKTVNKGQMRFARMEEMSVIASHLSNVKRIETENGRGERVASWVKTGDDHYAHALNYLHMADSMLGFRGKHAPIAALPLIGKAQIKTEPEHVESQLLQ